MIIFLPTFICHGRLLLLPQATRNLCAVGKDSSKAELQGGGIIRFRPDGTELEVLSSGTRNHLDVAINDEMECSRMITPMMATAGGLASPIWSIAAVRLPHDYKPQRPYTLWMIKDYGGGSPTGAIALTTMRCPPNITAIYS